jgi:hypothetical protein
MHLYVTYSMSSGKVENPQYLKLSILLRRYRYFASYEVKFRLLNIFKKDSAIQRKHLAGTLLPTILDFI